MPSTTQSPSVSTFESQSPSQTQASGSNFTSVQSVPNGLFNYGGSTSWVPIRLIVDPKIEAAQPRFRLRYVDPSSVAPGSSSGIWMLIEGNITFA